MDYKAILLHNAEHEDTHVIINVPFTRYKKILTDYKTERAIFVEGAIENYIEKYKSYILSELRGKNNSYKIVKTKEVEIKGKCEGCKCEKNRWINPRTGVCYYEEMINKDYTTKIKNN
jgi:hypothetical protein